MREQHVTPKDHANLWPAKQLVGGEADDIDARCDAFSRRWLVRQTPSLGVEQRAAAEVMNVMDASGMRDG